MFLAPRTSVSLTDVTFQRLKLEADVEGGVIFLSLFLKSLVGQTVSYRCAPGIHSGSFLESDSVHPSITVFGPQSGEKAAHIMKRAERPRHQDEASCRRRDSRGSL